MASYSYDAWGNPIEWSGPMAERNPIRYRGYYYDTETGFYYLQSRYYDPQTGRFINADGLITTGQGLMSYNMFAYCLDNPVNGIDPYGSTNISLLSADSGGKPLSVFEYGIKLIATELTSYSIKVITGNGTNYTTCYVSVRSNEFLPYKNTFQLSKAVAVYSHYVFLETKKRADESNQQTFYLMSEAHIYSELMAHLLLWFSPIGRSLGFGPVYVKTKNADLNVNESRGSVRYLMMICGFNWEEELYEK